MLNIAGQVFFHPLSYILCTLHMHTYIHTRTHKKGTLSSQKKLNMNKSWRLYNTEHSYIMQHTYMVRLSLSLSLSHTDTHTHTDRLSLSL